MPTTTQANRFFLSVFLFVAFVTLLSSCIATTSVQQNPVVSSEKIQLLKNKTVVFILPENELEYTEDYKSMLSKAWTLTPIEVVKYKDLGKYSEDAGRYAFFAIAGFRHTSTSQTGSYSNTHYYLTLSLPYGATKKGKAKTYELCRIELYPDTYTVNRFSENDAKNQLYSRGEFRNFRLPYMLAYLRFVQKNLQEGKNPWVYKDYSDEGLRSKLRRDTLYVPAGILFDRNKFSGEDDAKEKSFFDSYEGPHKYVSASELTDIIKRKPSKPIFLFEYVLSSTDKYVGVLEINSGTVVYRKYTGVSYNIKSKDLKAILD